MKTKRKNNKRKRKLADDEHDPLAEELDFNDLEIVGWGPGWALVPKHLRSPKHHREARAWLARKTASTKTNTATKPRRVA